MGSKQSAPIHQGVEVTDDTRPSEGPPHRLTEGPLPTESKHGAEVDNLYASFKRAAEMYPDNNCFGSRPKLEKGYGPFEWISYAEVHKRVLALAAALKELKLPRKATFGMYTGNSADFQIATLALFGLGLTCVPIYDTLGENIVEYEVNHAEISIIFVENKKAKAVSHVVKKCPSLTRIVLLQDSDLDAETEQAFSAAGVTVMKFSELMTKGTQADPVELTPAGRNDLAFIMYTSGTTGDPKGVCLTQIGLTVGASYCAGIEILPTERYLSYLPLAHIFETMVEHGVLSAGGAIGFFSGEIKLLSDDILALKPTLFCGVPRIYQRFYEKAMDSISKKPAALRKTIMAMLESEMRHVHDGHRGKWGGILAKLLGKAVHGGEVRIMLSGAAPLPTHVQDFLNASMGCAVMQGYGMTENAANATLGHKDDTRGGHVGPPMPTTEVKLVDVPEMNYTTAANHSGEVCTRSICSTTGYYKNKEETDKVLEPDGWLHTGDIGRWNPDGTLSIIDRKKNIFKLAQGEYIAAEKIEMCISKSKYVSQPWIYGNSFETQLVAVVTPDFAELKAAAKDGGWFCEDQVELAAKPEAIKFILDACIAMGKEAKLKSFELPAAVHLEGVTNALLQGFSVENDLLTPTFKLKRPQLLKRYQEEVNAMYAKLHKK